MFERQIQHALLLAVLLLGATAAAYTNSAVTAGQLAGLPTSTWLVVALAVPILHQVYVWAVWRTELDSAALSRWLGKDRAFRYYAFGFLSLFLARAVSILLVALANRGTLDLHPAVAYTVAGLLLIPWLYVEYSVQKYFGWDRALGRDHFDASYRQRPFVRQGMFRYTKNAMYTFGFLVFWVLGLAFLSQAALLAALFSHLYIWVHYYCTELPDIKTIYGETTGR